MKRSLQTRIFLLCSTQTGSQYNCEAKWSPSPRTQPVPACSKRSIPTPRAAPGRAVSPADDHDKESNCSTAVFPIFTNLASVLVHSGWGTVHPYLWARAPYNKQEPGDLETNTGSEPRAPGWLSGAESPHGDGTDSEWTNLSLDSSFVPWQLCDSCG